MSLMHKEDYLRNKYNKKPLKPLVLPEWKQNHQ